MAEEHWLLKHVETPLPDLRVIVRVNYRARQVELIADSFDSWLVGHLVVHSLPKKSGLVVFFDSSRPRDSNVYSDWRLVYVLAGFD